MELDEAGREAFAEPLAAAGFETAGETPWARVVEAREGTFEEVEGLVGWVLEGGVLAICGGFGPLLSALSLTPDAEPVEGAVEAAAPGAPPIHVAQPWPVTGVGYALYRVRERCIALAGPRGKGWVAYVGAREPALVAACLAWIRTHGTRAC